MKRNMQEQIMNDGQMCKGASQGGHTSVDNDERYRCWAGPWVKGLGNAFPVAPLLTPHRPPTPRNSCCIIHAHVVTRREWGALTPSSGEACSSHSKILTNTTTYNILLPFTTFCEISPQNLNSLEYQQLPPKRKQPSY